MRKVLMFLLISEVLGVPLIGVQCSPQVYAHELFSCKIFFSSTESDKVIFNVNGEGPFLVEERIDVILRPGVVSEREVNVWAKDVGRGKVFVRGEGCGAYAEVEAINPPLSVIVEGKDLEPGKENYLKVHLVGKAHGVTLWMEGPSSFGLEGNYEAGEVEGRKSVDVKLIVPPYAFGEHELSLYVSFTDARGQHLLKYPVKVNVALPLWIYGLILALLVVVYIFYWRKGRGTVKK